MTHLKTPEKWSTIEIVPFVISGAGRRSRRIAGLGINLIGAGVLLVEGVRWLSI